MGSGDTNKICPSLAASVVAANFFQDDKETAFIINEAKSNAHVNIRIPDN